MGFTVNTNLSANNAYRNLNNTQSALNKSLEKLSSGLRINRAADDAAGLAISEGMKSQIGGLTVAATNAQDGVNVIQTAEGGLSQAQSILQRLRDLAVQGANDSNNADSRGAIKTEADSLVLELGRIAGSTNFGGTKLLDGSAGSAGDGKLNFQVGANGDGASQIQIDLAGSNVSTIATTLASGAGSATGTAYAIDPAALATIGGPATFTTTTGGVATSVTTDSSFGAVGSFNSVKDYAAALNSDKNFSASFTATVTTGANGEGNGIVVKANDGGAVTSATAPAGLTQGTVGVAGTGGLDFTSAASSQDAINTLDAQITSVSTARATLGATQNRLESAIQTINISKENLSASASRITDTDMASEMVKYTRSSILSQAGTAMLAQANQSNQGVLKLLQ
ncbi:flagellin [Paenarthrobacter sp. Z7-10]|uniref:flagellin N-terminal helical domain-containing protein n=1 Tax=Paenarthrobacter sp. Z7-10 TaxID=2787635 RepID=UPI0022A9D930|nr:flagellin [Paenarthrobacter sp. Z7-10]MCZ2403327.1 flagellin [Paenarthrobacter sp. Z7-10]